MQILDSLVLSSRVVDLRCDHETNHQANGIQEKASYRSVPQVSIIALRKIDEKP